MLACADEKEKIMFILFHHGCLNELTDRQLIIKERTFYIHDGYIKFDFVRIILRGHNKVSSKNITTIMQ